jgi:hypothetical protein
MSKSINKNKKMNLFTKRNAIIAAVTLVVAIPAAIYGYNKWLDYSDQQRFLTLKSDAEEIQKRLETALPDIEWKLVPTCRRAHLTFGDGAASCEVLVTGEEQASSGQEASSLSAKLDDVFGSSTDLLAIRREGTEKPAGFIGKLEAGIVGNGYNSLSTGIMCSTLKEVLAKDSNRIFAFTLSCVDDSRDIWFPRSDK